jgi:spermidine synthase
MIMAWQHDAVEVIERCPGREGELQLQRRGIEYEIIYNGVFLMATYNGASEKAAVRDALKIITGSDTGPLAVLIGGLGVGYSLQEALAWEEVGRVTVVEIEPTIIRWNREILEAVNGGVLNDSRVLLKEGDLRVLLKRQARIASRQANQKYHLIMIDTDNGSSWLSLPTNQIFYEPAGLELTQRCLYPGGIACYWCSRREESFEKRLKDFFSRVSFHSVLERTGQEGCYYLASMG